MFGQSPSDYLGITDYQTRTAIDLACAVGFWEDENYKFKVSKEQAGNEADAIGAELDQYQKELRER